MKEKAKCIFLGWGYEGKEELYPIEQMPKQLFFDHFIKPINEVMGLNLKIREQRQQFTDTPEKSNLTIATALGVSDKTVGVQRKEMESCSEIPNVANP